MKKNNHVLRIIVTLILVIALSHKSYAQKTPIKPIPKLITLDNLSPSSAQVLHGPPETVTMHSGFMVLVPAKSVGKHSTKDNEEAIVVMAGKGEFKIIGGETFEMHPYSVIYCPPNTEHDVTNTGPDTLRYVYIVARAIKQ
jgi:mannose-6-phosphate isomerase-like protein (cupin superfamily)